MVFRRHPTDPCPGPATIKARAGHCATFIVKGKPYKLMPSADGAELVGLQPDIILAGSTPATAAVQRETRTIPIVFVAVGDPVASGLVARLDRPRGNITGFASLEATLGGKWLELLSEIAPGLKRVAFMFNPDNPAVSVFMPSLETGPVTQGRADHCAHS
jgi:putative ABC transport system substrate-binding protein